MPLNLFDVHLQCHVPCAFGRCRTIRRLVNSLEALKMEQMALREAFETPQDQYYYY